MITAIAPNSDSPYLGVYRTLVNGSHTYIGPELSFKENFDEIAAGLYMDGIRPLWAFVVEEAPKQRKAERRHPGAYVLTPIESMRYISWYIHGDEVSSVRRGVASKDKDAMIGQL